MHFLQKQSHYFSNDPRTTYEYVCKIFVVISNSSLIKIYCFNTYFHLIYPAPLCMAAMQNGNKNMRYEKSGNEIDC